MKKFFKSFLSALVAILMLVLLSGCYHTVVTPTEENEPTRYNAYHESVSANDSSVTEEQIASLANETATLTEETQIDIPIEMQDYEDGGWCLWQECERHHDIFHSYSFFWDLAGDFVCIDDVVAWETPLRYLEEETGECLVNYFTFINYFNIPREVFQERIDNNYWLYFRFGGDTLDVLYSGDWALVDQFFAQVDHVGRGFVEREDRHWSERIIAAQQIVNENTSGMSGYFHDIWTYSHFLGGKSGRAHWMNELISNGEYDRVNIVEFINHFGLEQPSSRSPGISIFEYWATHDNLNIFTHYNFNILLSGDMDLIREYYSIANEPYHTAQVQARFDAYVAANGYTPDTSWMINREPQDVDPQPTIISLTPNPATVQRGNTVELTVTTKGMPDGAWVDLFAEWRPGLTVVASPRFYIENNQAIITISAAEDTAIGRDGFAIAARIADAWGGAVIIDYYSFVIDVQ